MKKISIGLICCSCWMAQAQQPSVANAGRILGYSASLTTFDRSTANGVQKQRWTFTASPADSSHLYVSLETYGSLGAAQKMLHFLTAQNQNMPGWKTVSGIGDEAINDTDGEHFILVIVRKGPKLVRLKVNRLTRSTASTAAIQQMALHLLQYTSYTPPFVVGNSTTPPSCLLSRTGLPLPVIRTSA